MKLIWTGIAIMLVGLVIVWGVFFSGANVKKNDNESSLTSGGSNDMNSTSSNTVVLDTNYGLITIKLDAVSAPQTVDNFKKLISEKFYDNLTFHRIVPGFVIQGGDPKGDGTGSPGYTVPAEIKLLHTRGAVAMARLGDAVNPKRDSSGSQFYICLDDLPALDGAYTVFGEVVSGLEIVDQIARVRTDENDKPAEAVIIKRAYLE